MSMKKIMKVSLLLASVSLVLSACETLEKKAFILETSNIAEYVDGMCYQASYKDVVDTVYVICLPINPEANPSDYQYDVTFVDDISNTYVTLTDGLIEKRVNSVFKLGDNMLKVNINKACNEEATFGYIRINKRAFKANTERANEANLYAYVAIGKEGKSLAEKPVINEDGTIAQ